MVADGGWRMIGMEAPQESPQPLSTYILSLCRQRQHVRQFRGIRRAFLNHHSLYIARFRTLILRSFGNAAPSPHSISSASFFTIPSYPGAIILCFP
jgi:hypothetical protein